MAGPYGAAPFKFPPEQKLKGKESGKNGSATSGRTMDDTSSELNDTEWPLEKTLPLPKGYTTIGMKRPSTTNNTVLLLTMTAEKKEDPEDAQKTAEDQRYAALLRARSGTHARLQVPAKKSEFDPILQCPTCKRRMVEPKVVCCRRLCQNCLQQDIDRCPQDGVYGCKMCGSTVLIPDPKQPKKNWARQFETDVFLSNLREAVQQLEGKRLCFVCSSRNVTMDACNYCFDCATYFCQPCTESHRHMPNQKNHRVKNLDKITATELMKNKKRFCRVHEGISLDLYCNVHKAAMCQQCAVTVHQECGSITTVAKLATEKKEKLKTAEKVLEVGLSKCEHNVKQFQTETAEIEQIKKQTQKEIESSFEQVFKALQTRKSKLQNDIEEHFSTDQPEIAAVKKKQENLMQSMKSKTTFLHQLMQHASDFDIMHCADNVLTSAETMVSQNTSAVETPRPTVVVKMDDRAVKNFVELVSILGAEAGSTQVKGILLKKITTRLKGDQFTPDIRDIFLADVGHVVVVDNKNMCVKSIQISGDTFVTKRLEVNSEPWGGTKLQPSMIAVTGLKSIYIITLSDQMSLQSTVKTRKDYWGVCAISPINLACSCKYPPSVDIVDITGRRLRSIDEDHLGHQVFEVPTYVTMNGDNILVMDRKRKSLICVNQEGKLIFEYKGQGEEALEFPHGICVDHQGRIFIADYGRDCVELLSKHGDYLCQVMAAPKPRTLSLDNNDKTLYVSTEGKGLTFFNLIEVQT